MQPRPFGFTQGRPEHAEGRRYENTKNLFVGLAICCALVGLAPAHPARAMAPQAGDAVQASVSTVAYVDILPANRAQAIDAFQKYKEASRAEAGFIGLDIYEQQRRGAYYVLIETWATSAALDAHARAPHTAALLSAMARLGISGYDQRPYKPLTVAPARPVNPQAVYVVTHVDTAPTPGADPPGILKTLAEKSRAEAGNLRFDVLQHTMRANHFTVIETWENPAALDAHAAAPHTRQYRLAILPLSGSPVDERLYRAID
jgi:quinol monooxygenase YgiN